jgi:hypothetical protein
MGSTMGSTSTMGSNMGSWGHYLDIAIPNLTIHLDHGVDPMVNGVDPMVDLDHVEVVKVGPQWGRFSTLPLITF